MLTAKDIEKLKGTFATKEDLKGFATKEDLKGFATKEDLKGFATKEDLKRSIKKSTEETKRHFDVVAEGIKNSIAFLAEQISVKDSKVDEHEEKIETLITDVSVLKVKMVAVEAKAGK